MTVPTQGETLSKLLHHHDELANCVAMLAHLARAQSNEGKDRAVADGWIAVGEMLKRQRYQFVMLAQGKLQ